VKQKDPRPLPKLAYTLDEWCEATGMSRSHWNREIAAKRLPVIREGKRVLIPASEAERRFKAA
jgi:excisionase family DNA binding protein